MLDVSDISICRNVAVPLPDIVGRKQILSLYAEKIPLSDDVDIDVLARATPGMSGAMLSNMVNEAALRVSVYCLRCQVIFAYPTYLSGFVARCRRSRYESV